MKKVLFVSSEFHGYERRIMKAIEDVLKYKVFFLNYKVKREKLNIFERVYNNLILKPFFNKNINSIKRDKKMIEKIKKFGDFDYVLCIRPDLVGENTIKYIKSLNKKMILHSWDSLSWYPILKKYLHYFDKISIFDEKESHEFKLDFVPNFYIKDYAAKYKDIEIRYDIFTVMSYGYRMEMLEKIAKNFKEKGIKYKFIVVTDKDIKSDYVEIRKEGLNIEETYKNMMEAKAVLEIGHATVEREQGGLSFRAIEALGCQRKLVTTYDLIKTYDFYNENNIKIISTDSYEIEEEFFEKPYEYVESKIYQEYSDENWVKKVFI